MCPKCREYIDTVLPNVGSSNEEMSDHVLFCPGIEKEKEEEMTLEERWDDAIKKFDAAMLDANIACADAMRELKGGK